MAALNTSDAHTPASGSSVTLPAFMTTPSWTITRSADCLAAGLGIALAIAPTWKHPNLAIYWLGAALTILATSLVWKTMLHGHEAVRRAPEGTIGRWPLRYRLPQTVWPGAIIMAGAGWLGALAAQTLLVTLIPPDHGAGPTLGVGVAGTLLAMTVGWRIVWAFIRAHDDMRPRRAGSHDRDHQRQQ